MSNSKERFWSDNTPKIPHRLYLQEKAHFAGAYIASIQYGILIVLFFQCMAALFNPNNRRRDGIRWWIVSFTVLMFLFATITIWITLHLYSICYIDNRKYPGAEDGLPSGPLGYWFHISPEALLMTGSLMTDLSYWLADGFLLYRCYVIYAANIWAIAFPCLFYLGSVAIGIVVLAFQAGGWVAIDLTVARNSIMLSVNVLLTLMIVIRLLLHGRNIRAATGSPGGISGLYKTIAAMLIESSALFAVNSLLFLVWLIAEHHVYCTFTPTLVEIQAVASLLIVKRVANKTALTSDTIVTGRISSFRVGRQGEPTDSSVLPATGGSVGLVDEKGRNFVEFQVREVAEPAIDLHRNQIRVFAI